MEHTTLEILSDEDIAEIRKFAAEGVSQRIIAAGFGVSRPTITRLLNGATWKPKR
jgi:DNA invertase Pin-like site-specific DNA recombinase